MAKHWEERRYQSRRGVHKRGDSAQFSLAEMLLEQWLQVLRKPAIVRAEETLHMREEIFRLSPVSLRIVSEKQDVPYQTCLLVDPLQNDI